ncbi:hypothetical protein K4F52_001833 [Lecanicillium sp. MT-2017a]|nr:hypothetical protein K4F52_001833 [Lecanicillium sp. MT-2017a]
MSVLDQLEALVLGNFLHQKDVAACFAELGTPSTSIAILDNGSLSSKCYSTVGSDVDTVFQACSISKPINGLAVMKLVDEGRLSLSNTVAELLPKEYLDILTEGSPANQRSIVEKITVKQLMSHTAGLTVHGFLGYPKGSLVPKLREILAGANPSNSPRIRMNALPGYGHSYSGGGITVLQLIVETVVGKDYPTLMQELVLGPLEMTRSFIAPVPADEKNVANAHFTAYTKCCRCGLWTTPTDLLKAVQAVQKSLAGDGGFLRKETAELMTTEVDDGMGLSWGVLGKSKQGFTHTGQNLGFACVVAGFAKLGSTEVPENSGIAIMTDSDMGSEVFMKVARAVAGIQAWPWPTNSESWDRLPRQFSRPASESGDDWKEWKGKWVEGAHSYVVGESKDGEPMVTFDESAEVRLLPASNSRRRENGSFSDFLLEAMDMMMCFEEKDGEKIIKLHRLSAESRELKREGSGTESK